MKLIWVLPENRGQNSIFRPNRVKSVSTGQPVTEQCNTTGRPVVCTPVDRTGRPISLQSGRPHRSTGFHVIRSTALVDRWNQLRERSSRKPVQNLQISVPNRDISKENH
ncbi:hypothetical protein L484_006476 [Morus notabilis]|uniref:Uncharacterized protein n=1 Tax=Morus notabilis TaxID=981085 RepID=W9S6B4_9ROSA|nr:hypothetical protein L484_006476 [Morus notabilis]